MPTLCLNRTASSSATTAPWIRSPARCPATRNARWPTSAPATPANHRPAKVLGSGSSCGRHLPRSPRTNRADWATGWRTRLRPCVQGSVIIHLRGRLRRLRKFEEEEDGGGWGRDRTADTAIFSRMLYQLSYPAAPKSANQTRGGLPLARWFSKILRADRARVTSDPGSPSILPGSP